MTQYVHPKPHLFAPYLVEGMIMKRWLESHPKIARAGNVVLDILFNMVLMFVIGWWLPNQSVYVHYYQVAWWVNLASILFSWLPFVLCLIVLGEADKYEPGTTFLDESGKGYTTVHGLHPEVARLINRTLVSIGSFFSGVLIQVWLT
jgi:hypothetical protein